MLVNITEDSATFTFTEDQEGEQFNEWWYDEGVDAFFEWYDQFLIEQFGIEEYDLDDDYEELRDEA